MGKALETRRLLRRHYGGIFRRHLVFYLLGKPKKPAFPDEAGLRTELLDIKDLAAALADAPKKVRRDTLGSHITFSQRELTETLFPSHHGPLEQRRFTAAVDRQRDFSAMQLGNCRYFTDVDTAEQTARVLDSLQEKYAAGQAALAQLLGTATFTVPPEEDWAQPLCRMPVWLWEELLRDAERRENLDGVELRVRDRQDGCCVTWAAYLTGSGFRRSFWPGQSLCCGIMAGLTAKMTHFREKFIFLPAAACGTMRAKGESVCCAWRSLCFW